MAGLGFATLTEYYFVVINQSPTTYVVCSVDLDRARGAQQPIPL